MTVASRTGGAPGGRSGRSARSARSGQSARSGRSGRRPSLAQWVAPEGVAYGIPHVSPVFTMGAIVLLCCATTYYYTLRSAERACHALGYRDAGCFAHGSSISTAAQNPALEPRPPRGAGDVRVGIPTRGANGLRDALEPHAPTTSGARTGAPPSPPSTIAGLRCNIRTSGAYNSEYTQVGFLSNGKEDILALHGRLIMSNRNKWQYYTASDKFHSVRLPITVGGKNASSEYGCDEVSNGDSVYVEGYNMPFRVTLYEKQGLEYIPYI